MYIEEIIEVGIGLVFAWLILSLAVMQVQEWIAGWLGLRADGLEEIIWGMLSDPKESLNPVQRFWEQLKKILNRLPRVQLETPQPPPIVREMYDHPLIKGLARKGDKPSYIPADKFALVLFDLVMTAGTKQSTLQAALTKVENSLEDPTLNLTPEEIEYARKEINDLLAHQNLSPMEEKLSELKERFPQISQLLASIILAKPPKSDDAMLAQIINGASAMALRYPPLTRTLNTLVTQAKAFAKEGENKIILARTNVENWFNTTMERANGWYKRNRQIGAFAIAFILAAVINIDSISIATQLWREPAIRKAVIARAETFTLPEPTNSDEGNPQPESYDTLQKDIDKLVTQTFVSLKIPVGWEFTPVTPAPEKERCKLNPKPDSGEIAGLWINGQCVQWVNPQGWGWITKIAGIVISAAAGMQGAPFWFDILKKLINIRSAGKSPEEDKPKAAPQA